MHRKQVLQMPTLDHQNLHITTWRQVRKLKARTQIVRVPETPRHQILLVMF